MRPRREVQPGAAPAFTATVPAQAVSVMVSAAADAAGPKNPVDHI
jgi:hypothetical protein